MELWGSKVIALCSMAALTLIFGLLPICMMHVLQNVTSNAVNRAKLDKCMSLLNCVVGGVFLSTTNVHLMPEVREVTESYLKEYNIQLSFSLADVIICAGFFFIMLVEHMVMACQHHHSDVPFDTKNDFVEKAPLLTETKAVEKAPLLTETKAVTYGTQLSDTSLDGDRDSPIVHFKGNDRSPPGNDGDHGDPREILRQRHHQHNGEVVPRFPSRQASVISEGACVHVIHPDHHSHHHVQASQLAGIRSFLLLLAMSLHTVFEGLAIGLQSTYTEVWNLFIAVVFHKIVISFSLGVQFAEHITHKGRATLFIVLFAFMSCLGIAIGTGVTAGSRGDSPAVDVAEGVLTAMATGTLIYVTFFEVLMAEIGSDHSLVKVLFVIIGFTAMTLLSIFNHE